MHGKIDLQSPPFGHILFFQHYIMKIPSPFTLNFRILHLGEMSYQFFFFVHLWMRPFDFCFLICIEHCNYCFYNFTLFHDPYDFSPFRKMEHIMKKCLYDDVPVSSFCAIGQTQICDPRPSTKCCYQTSQQKGNNFGIPPHEE